MTTATARAARLKEQSRLQTLADYGVLDTAPEEAFDRLTRLAADLFDAPIALVSLIDARRQWFKSRHGLEVRATPRKFAFCNHTIQLAAGETLVVEDANRDPRFQENPFVTGPPGVRFYAGAVLTAADGSNLGSLCVIDTKARPAPSAEDLRRLSLLAEMVVGELELRHARRLGDEKQRMLELAERMSGVGHWRYRLADGQVLWSEEMFRIHGLARGSGRITSAKVMSFFTPEDRATVEALMAEAIRTGQGYNFEFPLRRSDGEVRDVVCRADCILDGQGKVTALFGVFQDVSEQRRTFQRVARGKARYKLLADNVADVITRIRLDGGGSYISPAIEPMLGYRPAEMVGRSADSFVYEPDRPLIQAVLAEMAGGVEKRTVQLRAAHKVGHPVWIETHLKLIRNAAGTPEEVVAVIRDISRRKVMEGELQAARAEAEAAAAVKAEFLANMSHELRTPLTSIIGFTGLAAEQPDLTPLTRNYVERVGDASRALLATVNDILDFSKLEAGQVTIEPEPVVLSQLARATLDLFTPQAGSRDLTLTLDGDIANDLVLAIDPDRMRQILLNLVGNAVKFTARGGVTLRIHYDDLCAMLHMEVIDTGEGVPAAKQQRLFKRFSQVDGSLTRGHGGTGLGLAICKGLVEAMGGEIGVESEVGVGSRFWFRIPAPRADPEAAVAEEPTLARPALNGVRVLVADDHPANRELARLFLAGIGAEVVEVADGLAAAKMAMRLPFDVILMDVRMPKLDGAGALRRIRATPGPNAGTPVLAFTADASREQVAQFIAVGFHSVVSKPVDVTALIAAVARAAAASVGDQLSEDVAWTPRSAM